MIQCYGKCKAKLLLYAYVNIFTGKRMSLLVWKVSVTYVPDVWARPKNIYPPISCRSLPQKKGGSWDFSGGFRRRSGKVSKVKENENT